MTLRETLLRVARAYAEAASISEARLGTLLFNDGKKLGLLAAGRDLNTGTFEAAMQWLSDNWPDGADWPAGVVRPSVSVSPGENSPAADAGLRPEGAEAQSRLPAPPDPGSQSGAGARPQTPEAAE